MNKKILFSILAAVIILMSSIIFVILIIQPETYKTTPTKNNGEKWRIGYYEGGSYINYAKYLKVVVNGFIELDWMDNITIPEFNDSEDTSMIWQFLSNNVTSNYLEFVYDAYWSANWDDGLRKANQENAILRFSTTQDIDLMLALGTWAGIDLANNNHSVPTLVLSTSDPIGAGIIKSAEDSGLDHVLAKVDPNLYLRQIQFFHDVVGFKKIGVVYENTTEGRLYASLHFLKEVAQERGFEVVECHAQDTGLTDEECMEEVSKCYQNLAPKIDALWIGLHRGENLKYMPGILEPMFEYNVSTWASEGSNPVKRGVLLSISRIDYSYAGKWAAEVIAKIFNGAKPRNLSQIFEHPNRIAINLETARRIGFELPKGLIDVADEVYDTIETDG